MACGACDLVEELDFENDLLETELEAAIAETNRLRAAVNRFLAATTLDLMGRATRDARVELAAVTA